MANKPLILAALAALAACVIWSGNFVIARGVHEWIAPFTLSFWRWSVALVALLPFSIMGLKKEWPIVRQNWRYLLIMGTVGVATFNALIYFAAQTTTTSHISIISSTTPIFTLILAAMVGEEKLASPKVFGAMLACIGALVIITQGQVSTLINQSWHGGDVLVVVSSLIWAIWSVGLRFKPKGLSSISFMSVVTMVGVVTLAPFYAWEAQTHTLDLFNLKLWLVFLYVGLFGSVVAWLLWQYSVEQIGSVRTSLIYYSMPVLSSLLAMLVLGETLHFYHAFGFGLVFLGILVALFFKKKQSVH